MMINRQQHATAGSVKTLCEDPTHIVLMIGEIDKTDSVRLKLTGLFGTEAHTTYTIRPLW
ncbi:MAG: hypothetical protein U9N46_14525 [Euryarchaeota archaeon]|nr:hypothetical protein [Euryarchaeota archaeon]